DVSALTVIAVLLVPATYLLLWRTPFGLRLRSCGENPKAAESLGVNVYLYKYYGVMISGGLAGLGGVFLSMVASSIYREGQTGGRGFIGLAAMIFGNWRPGGLAAGALLFGYTDAAQLRRGSESVHALLVLVAMRRAYAPYSRFPVGAAGLVDDGRVLTACNVENVSYGLSLCAECGLVSALHASGGGRLIAVSCVDARGAVLMPCGRCRQLLWEHGGPDCLVASGGDPIRLADLL